MKKMSQEEFRDILKRRKVGERLAICDRELHDMDVSGWDLGNIDFTKSAFQRMKFERTDFSRSCLKDALFEDRTSLREANFTEACLAGTAFRYCDLTDCNIKGANLYCAVLEFARIKGILSDESTKWFRMYCPEEGAFLGYKKCVNDRLVQLLIPPDAKRTSATRPSCRCSKAKVLTIKSFDYRESFREAWSLVDEEFVYRVGQWVEVCDFNEDRWMDSTTGIHFWMTREEAKGY